MSDREYAYFTARGTGDPSDVTDSIGIQPTRCYRSGDVNPTTGKTYGISEWRLDSSEPDTAPIAQHVDSLLLWLNRRPSALLALQADFDLTLHCVMHSTGASQGLYLSATQTRILGRLGIAIDVDGYMLDDETA